MRSRAAGFVRSRTQRLLIPLALGMWVIVPPQSWAEVTEAVGYRGGYLHFMALYAQGYGGFCREDCLRMPTWNHLWFVAYLWCYTMVAAFAWWAIRGAASIAWAPRSPRRLRGPWLYRAAGGLAGGDPHRARRALSRHPRARRRLVHARQLLQRVRARACCWRARPACGRRSGASAGRRSRWRWWATRVVRRILALRRRRAAGVAAPGASACSTRSTSGARSSPRSASRANGTRPTRARGATSPRRSSRSTSCTRRPSCCWRTS